MRVKGQKSVKVTDKCHTYLKAISKRSEITITQFLDDFVICFFENVASQYPNGFSINYMPSVSGSYVMVQALSNKNRILYSGTFKVTSPEQVKEFEKQLYDNAMPKVEKTTLFDTCAELLQREKLSKSKNKNKSEVN